MHASPSEATTCGQLIRSLRSVRRFATEPIPPRVLDDILDIARWTGSAKNTQPWELVVVRQPETLRLLATLGRYAGHLAGAPAAVALVMNGPDRGLDEGRLAQNLMLAAWVHGVGSCIASLFPEENEWRAKERLGVPPERFLRTAISLGYPADERALRLSAERGSGLTLPLGRRRLDELVSWERYGARTG